MRLLRLPAEGVLEDERTETAFRQPAPNDAWRNEELGEEFVAGETVPVVARPLRDGTTFNVVKAFWDPIELQSRLQSLGWSVEAHRSGPLLLDQRLVPHTLNIHQLRQSLRHRDLRTMSAFYLDRRHIEAYSHGSS